MYKLIYLLLFFLVVSSGLAQDKKIDSLKKVYSTHKSDTIGVNVLNEIGWVYYKQRNAQKSLAYNLKAGDLAKRLRNDLMFAKTLYLKINVLGDIQNNYPLALHYSFEQLKIFEKLKDSIHMSYAYSNIASIYDDIGDFASAVKYSKKELEIIEKNDLKEQQTWVNSSIGYYYLQMKNTRDALPYFQKSLQMAKNSKKNQEDQLAFSLYGIGKINWENNEENIAAAYYYEALKHYKKKLRQGFVQQLIYIGIADLHRSKKRIDSANYYNKLALESSKTKSRITLGIFRNLAELNAQQNPQQSVAYYNNFMTLNDSLFNDRKNKEIQNLTTNELEREREKVEKERLEAEDRQHYLQYAGIAIAITAFLLLIILLSRSIIVNKKWIEILGVIGLLLTFEFINLLLHPYVGALTHHSPVAMLLIMVVIAALLVPMHHKIEHWATHQMVEKNKQVRLKAAHKILEKEQDNLESP